jgi:hypothetical protein
VAVFCEDGGGHPSCIKEKLLVWLNIYQLRGNEGREPWSLLLTEVMEFDVRLLM